MLPSRKAMTLTEVVVASVVFLAFCIPILGLLSTARFGTKRQTHKLQAVLIAQSMLNEARHNSQVRGYSGTRFKYPVPKGFTVKKTYSSFPGQEEGLTFYTVEVEWLEFKKKRELVVTTLISQKDAFYEFKN
jgi:hypothetical protein